MQQAGPQNNWHYNKALQKKANALRKEMTKAEVQLWKHALKAKQMKDYQFRRQRPVLQYIADFMCKELMLIIEVDGLTHLDEATLRKDDKKDAHLKSVGFCVMRFADEEVLADIENVKRRIEIYIEEFEQKFSD
jgi:very-short-patch-repair endonuclease